MKEWIDINCLRCGEFQLDDRAIRFIDSILTSDTERSLISGWIIEHSLLEPVSISYDNLKNLSSQVPPSVGEKAQKLMTHLGKKYPIPGTPFLEDLQTLYRENDPNSPFSIIGPIHSPMLTREFYNAWGASWASNFQELVYLFAVYLQNQKHYLVFNKHWLITPEGWDYLDSLKQENPNSHQAFVAMWFDDSMNECFDSGIDPAIKDAGYNSFRVDRHEHVNRIDDEIIAQIRQSKFLVADFTEHRGGVYFEAGYALGMGIRVIWLCREDNIEHAHFDTNHFNHILWTPEDIPGLKKALQNRIEAVIGKGPVRDE